MSTYGSDEVQTQSQALRPGSRAPHSPGGRADVEGGDGQV